MEDNKIIVKLGKLSKIELDTDTPDIAALVNAIVEHRDSLDPTTIEVECSFEGFDCAGFQEVILSATQDLLEKIKTNDDDLKKALADISKQKKLMIV